MRRCRPFTIRVLDSHPQHELAKSTLEGGFGSMVAFELRGGVEAASKFIRSLKHDQVRGEPGGDVHDGVAPGEDVA